MALLRCCLLSLLFASAYVSVEAASPAGHNIPAAGFQAITITRTSAPSSLHRNDEPTKGSPRVPRRDAPKPAQAAYTKILFAAVNADDADGVRDSVEAGARINENGSEYSHGKQTPLMLASLTGKPAAAKELLALGADPTIGEEQGYTPLHGAGFQGRAALVPILMADSRVPNDMHKDGFFPLHRACWGEEPRHAETVRAFLTAGVDPALLTRSGQTPLQLARESGNMATVAVLKEALAAAEAARQEGGTHGAEDEL